MRSKWKGHLRIGLVQVPIQLFKTTDPKAGAVSFHHLHATCKGRLKMKNFCPACDAEVTDKARGFEYAKDQYLVVTDADLAQFTIPATKVIEITQIVEAADIPLLAIEESDFCAPDGPGARTAFVVIREALAGKAAIGTVVTRGREDLVAVQPLGAGLVVHHLRSAAEMRSMADIPDLDHLPAAPDLELQLAAQLLRVYQRPLDLDSFRDRYTEGVRAMLQAKATGTPLAATPAAVMVAPAADLMSVLRASLAAPVASPLATLPKAKPAKAALPAKAKKAAGK